MYIILLASGVLVCLKNGSGEKIVEREPISPDVVQSQPIGVGNQIGSHYEQQEL